MKPAPNLRFLDVLPRAKAPWARVAIVALTLLGAAAACGDPCRELSDSICKCMPSRAQAQACRKRVHALAAQNSRNAATQATPAQESACHDLLQSCSCERLAQGDFSACGLAED